MWPLHELGANLYPVDNPLAENFNIRAGQVTITVPDVPPRDDYIIVRKWQLLFASIKRTEPLRS